MPRLLTPDTHFAVERDGLPRVAAYDDGSQHVLYLDGAIVRSMAVRDWAPPLPRIPTQAESDTAAAALLVERQQQNSRRATERARAAGHVAVGTTVDSLTTPQLLGLVRAMAHSLGAVDDDGTIKPYDRWGV